MTSPSPTESDVEAMFTQYRRSQIAELRPYISGEDELDAWDVSVSSEDLKAGSPMAGDMVARNPKNHADRWLVAAKYFADNFEPVLPSQSPASADTPVSVGDGCDWPAKLFTMQDEPGEHDPCYLICPDGAMIPFCHHDTNGVDQARVKFIMDACNAALAASPHPVKPMTQDERGGKLRAYFSLILDLLRWASMGTPIVSGESIEADLELAIMQTKAWLKSSTPNNAHQGGSGDAGNLSKHGMNCPANLVGVGVWDSECLCGLGWRIELQTEREMHNAWRKRAEEAETKLQSSPATPAQEGDDATLEQDALLILVSVHKAAGLSKTGDVLLEGSELSSGVQQGLALQAIKGALRRSRPEPDTRLMKALDAFLAIGVPKTEKFWPCYEEVRDAFDALVRSRPSPAATKCFECDGTNIQAPICLTCNPELDARKLSQSPAPDIMGDSAEKNHGSSCSCHICIGIRRANAEVNARRWPFVETPGEFTDRLREAMRVMPSLLAAVRNVLIENPSALRADLDAKPDVSGLVEALKKIAEAADNEDAADPLDFIFETARKALATTSPQQEQGR